MFQDGSYLLHFIVLDYIKQIDIPMTARALQSVVEASLGSLEHGWEVGWSLASLNRVPQSLVTQAQVSIVSFTPFFPERKQFLSH